MSETTATATPEVKTPGKIVSAGKPSIATPSNVGATTEVVDTNAGGVDDGTEGQNGAGAGAAASGQPELTDDQMKVALAKLGITDFDGNLDAIKAKLQPAAAASAEPTAEEKAAADSAFEKRMLDLFIAGGGTAENFVALKQLASADLAAISETQIRRSMKEEGFDDDQINAIIKERYYQINPEELTIGEDESEEEFTKRKALVEKKIAFGTKQLAEKGAPIKKQAEDGLNVLRNAIKAEDLRKEEEAKTLSKVDEVATKLPRKFTFELGEVNGEAIAPVQYDVSDADVAAVVDTLKDSSKRNNILYNEDNSLNLAGIAEMMLKNQMLESALKATYLEGGNRQVEIFKKVFPGVNAKDIGVGGTPAGNNGGRKGHIVASGKPEAVRR